MDATPKQPVLVTGSASPISARLITTLLPSYDLIALDHQESPAGSNGVDWVQRDLTDDREFPNGLRQVHYPMSIRRAHERLGCAPRHRLENTLPSIHYRSVTI